MAIGTLFRRRLGSRRLRIGALRFIGSILPLLGFAILSGHAHGATLRGIGPCDIYGAFGTPCVAAHSTTRALYASYDGPLYQVLRLSDLKTKNIKVLAAGGFADAASQDRFCKDTSCTITRVYDQSPLHNDLAVAPTDAANKFTLPSVAAPASVLATTAGGHLVYGIEFFPGVGYRNASKTVGVAKSGEPEGMYMVTSGTLALATAPGGCCFDYGNAEAIEGDTGGGHQDAINFSNFCWFGRCYGKGPWVQGDLEDGLFQSDEGVGEDPRNTGNPTPFVTAMLKNNGQTRFTLKAGNAQRGTLKTTFDGGEPKVTSGALSIVNGLVQFMPVPSTDYSPMHQEGGIVLGTGGDDSNMNNGAFFEGVMTMGYPSDAADDAVQANVVSVGYGGPTGSAGTLRVNSEVSLLSQSPCCTDRYVAQGGLVSDKAMLIAISEATSAQVLGDATWIVRPGLAERSCISLEARNFPGEYLRQSSSEVYRQAVDGTPQFDSDATFCPKRGNSRAGKSFVSFNDPTTFLRSFDNLVYVAEDGGTSPWDTTIGFPDDSSFTLEPPLLP